jgi:two-component system, chemotaxis family, response regulator Rcp1
MAGIQANRLVEVLLVEDNPADADLARETMIDSLVPIRLNVVGDGVEAISYLNRGPSYEDAITPDIILLDLNLPRMDGRQVLEQIRANDTYRRVPVIILSSSDAEHDVVESYERGANCYVKKPYDHYNFQVVIRGIERFWFKIVLLPSENRHNRDLGGLDG